MALLFGYTAVRNGAENLGMSSAISVAINIVCGFPQLAPFTRILSLIISITVLRHTVRLHTRSFAIRASGDRQRHRRGTQPADGHCFGYCGNVREYFDACASVLMRGVVLGDGHCRRSLSV